MLNIIIECFISVKSIIDKLNIIIILCCGLLFMVIGMYAWNIVLRMALYIILYTHIWVQLTLILFGWVLISADRNIESYGKSQLFVYILTTFEQYLFVQGCWVNLT